MSQGSRQQETGRGEAGVAFGFARGGWARLEVSSFLDAGVAFGLAAAGRAPMCIGARPTPDTPTQVVSISPVSPPVVLYFAPGPCGRGVTSAYRSLLFGTSTPGHKGRGRNGGMRGDQTELPERFVLQERGWHCHNISAFPDLRSVVGRGASAAPVLVDRPENGMLWHKGIWQLWRTDMSQRSRLRQLV